MDGAVEQAWVYPVRHLDHKNGDVMNTPGLILAGLFIYLSARVLRRLTLPATDADIHLWMHQ
jgi:hypothetical protein